MAEIKQVFQIVTAPGVKRDGTLLDGDQYCEGQWLRFQRGKPKKMGGTQQITDRLAGPIRDCLVWSRSDMNAIYTFSSGKIEMVLVDNNGLGSSILDRTPAGMTTNTTGMWTTATLFNAAVGSVYTAVLAHRSNSLSNIDDTAETLCYYGNAADNSTFVSVGAIGPNGTGVSGGVFATAPYAIYHGTDGYVQWSDVNQPTVLTSGDAGSARVTGAKIVRGLPLRSGSGPAALLWSLDSVLRMDWIGGAAIFKFSHLSSQTSILSQRSVIEYDGLYFWLGVDRFLMCDGGKVQELPNQMNINWFFDNLNFDQRQKVWAMKVPRYGEIWWFFPYGSAEECTHAVIYNVREQCWYDNALARSAGYYSQVFHYPVMSESTPDPVQKAATISGLVGTISVGDLVEGVTSEAVALITNVIGSTYYLQVVTPDVSFISGEAITDATSGATATLATLNDTYSIYLHEKGTDAVKGDNVSAIQSYFTTADFGFPTGGAQVNQTQGINRWTRLVRIEPDFILSGDMTVEVHGKEFAQSPDVVSDPLTFDATTGKIDLREQRREIRLKFTSNTLGGHYEMGRTILHLEPGDVRS